MQAVGASHIYAFGDNTKPNGDLSRRSNTEIRASRAHMVDDYMELAKKVAALQFRNRDYVLMLRGQGKDYLNQKRNSSIRPSIFRPPKGDAKQLEFVLQQRFIRLQKAEHLLVQNYRKFGFKSGSAIERQRLLRWSLLQHYEICDTPLLDVTHSLRIAASFASDDDSTEAFLMVLGIPQISGGISASAEAELVAIRLASVCPPDAVRPHIQEGYLLGEYPEVGDWSSAQQVRTYEVDFGLRLISKFRFNPQKFWRSPAFPKVPRNALYPPSQDDPILELAQEIQAKLPPKAEADQ